MRGYYRTAGYYGINRRSAKGYPKELKFHDSTLTSVTLQQVGGVLNSSLNATAAGTGESQRIGRKITIHSITIRAVLTLPTATTKLTALDTWRLILVQDKQANGASVNWNTVMEDLRIDTHRNLAQKNRFNILMDRQGALNSQAGGGDGTTEDYIGVKKMFFFHKKLNMPIEFDGVTGGLTEIKSNNLVLLGISTNSLTEISCIIRNRFTG